MKFAFRTLAAALFCCLSCVEIDSGLGGNLIPADQTYTIHPTKTLLPPGSIRMQPADSLSGYSQTRITVGAIRDDEFGLTTRRCALTLVPARDSLDFGNVAAAKVVRFHFAAAFDTVSVSRSDQRNILQGVRVHSLSEPVRPGRDYDCNGSNLKVDYSKQIINGGAVLNGADSLSFDFTEEYARRFLQITQDDLGSFSRYTRKIPGIVISTDEPLGNGGRINIFELQTGYDSQVQYVTGNYAMLNLLCDYNYDGVPETDTAFFFAFGLMDFVKMDSLFQNSSRGNYPEYGLNLTSHETRPLAGDAGEEMLVEGGGGLKPVISALALKHLAEDLIAAEGGDPAAAVINKARIVLPFRFPADYRDMYKYPDMLSPTCRIRQNDTTVMYAGLTDSSSSDENQGDINRSTLRYEPDITYHLQELLKIHETPVEGESDTDRLRRAKLLGGEYDIWMIITAHEVVESTSTSSSLSDYYQMLMYQQYYNNMYYGGYGGYGGYGYGGYGYGGYGGYGYGYDPYTNYYSYMMMASMMGSSSSSSSTTDMLDKDRYYCAALYGPAYPDASLRPVFELTFSLANSEN